MAGYIIYSLDTAKFQNLVGRPTEKQLTVLGKLLREQLQEDDGEFDEDDPVLAWPKDSKGLARIAAERLPRQDWYGDLSDAGKHLWEVVIFRACMDHKGIDVGFRVDNDGVYWDVIEEAWKHLGVVPNVISTVALSTFGTKPFRYHPPEKQAKTREEYDKHEPVRKEALKHMSQALKQFSEAPAKPQKTPKATDPFQLLKDPKAFSKGLEDAFEQLFSTPAFAKLDKLIDEHPEAAADDADDWTPMHSMHPPEEVAKMLSELQSVEKAVRAAKDKSVREQYDNDLKPALQRIAKDGRMLFIQVDT